MDPHNRGSTPRQDALRVLLVEDCVADAELLVEMLADELPASSLLVAATLADARAALDQQPDVVITDLSLPDAEGLQALMGIRTAVPSVPVLVMTGRDDRELAMSALSAGADDYLVKGAHDARGVATAVLYALERRKAERDARRLERLAISLLDAMEAPTCAVDQSGLIVAVNRAWSDFARTDLGAVGVGGSYLDLHGAGETADAIALGLRRLLSGEVPRFELDYACHASEPPRWFSLRINPLPDAAGAVLTHVEVTAAKHAEQAFAHQTMHDPLTDLPNRLLLNDRLLQAMAAAQRDDLQVGVAFVDLDQFKRINDSLGHQAGDELLLSVAARLRHCVRAGDTVARFAGDEFVVVWPGLQDATEGEELAERLRTAFDAPFELQEATVALTASVGATVAAAAGSPDELLLAADAAMYDAKNHGRGRIRMYTSELREGVEVRLRTEAELREALAAQEFVLHYQPVVDLERRTVKGVEALVRWQHADGLRTPDTFIPVAEASGLIVPLGGWVLDEACRQASAWAAGGLVLDMAVNLSVRQVSHPDVLATIERALDRHGLDPQRLLLEVTESAVMEDAEAAQVALERIAALGAAIAIDDFGTGYSSLLYLKRYPVRALKIDRSFVSGMGVNHDDDAIVASIVSLARAVGSVCIAEGVETAAQQAALVGLGCGQAQGYLFGRPVPADEVPAAVAHAERVLRQTPPVPVAAVPQAAAPVDRAVLARIEQLREAGASAHTIAAALNRDGAPHPQGVQWHRVAVTQVARGCLPSTPRRRSIATAVPAQHRSHDLEVFSQARDLADRLAHRMHPPLAGSDAVVVVMRPEHRALLEDRLTAMGLDLRALEREGRYNAFDAQDMLGRLVVDGYLSARLFRQVVEDLVSSVRAAHGAVHVYGEMVALLWDAGNIEMALTLEDLWNALADRVSFTLVCGYPQSSLGSATPAQVERMRHQHGVTGPIGPVGCPVVA